MAEGDTYTHGHHEAVLRSHRSRTAENSCAYLLPHLRAGLDLLDVGCGPGTITIDLASRVAPGHVTGIDVVLVADPDAAPANVTFTTGDAYALEFDDASFDVVHVHQMLHHVSRPVEALREMRRVLKPGGLLAVRESDYGGFTWAPDDPRLTRWMELFHQVAARNSATVDAGRYLLGWVLRAGFTDVTASSSTWTFAGPDDRNWWGNLWADRIEQEGSAFPQQALEYGLTTREELCDLVTAFREWTTKDDAYAVVLHGEVLARR